MGSGERKKSILGRQEDLKQLREPNQLNVMWSIPRIDQMCKRESRIRDTINAQEISAPTEQFAKHIAQRPIALKRFAIPRIAGFQCVTGAQSQTMDSARLRRASRSSAAVLAAARANSESMRAIVSVRPAVEPAQHEDPQ